MANKKVRILVIHTVDAKKYLPNDVVDLDAADAAALVKAGVADDNTAAVAYALEQNGNQIIKHEKPAAKKVEAAAKEE